MYKVVFSNRRSLAIEVKRNGEVVVRAPHKINSGLIDEFVEKHSDWIKKTVRKQQLAALNEPELSVEEIKELKQRAKEILPKKVQYFSRLTGLKCTGVKITSAKSRYGSCNGKNSICFSYILMTKPEKAIDYVVLHELAHTKHHNHSKSFWDLVEKEMPDYKERRKLLK